MRFLLWLALLLVPMEALAVGRVFYDGFESGSIDTSKWIQDSGPTRDFPVVNSTSVHNGTKSAQFNWDGTVAWNATNAFSSMGAVDFNYNTEVLVRFWVRVDSTMDTDPEGNGPKMFKLGDGTNNEIYLALGAGGVLKHQSNASIAMPTFYGSSATYVRDYTWHKIEWYAKYASSGVIKLWMDGTLAHSWSGNTAVGGSWNQFHIPSNWSGATGCCDHDNNNKMYVDEVEIFTDTGTGSAAGCLANGNCVASGGGDTTPPSSVALTAPAAGATISASVAVSGTCTDETAVRGITFKYGTTNIAAEDTTSPYSVTWDTTTVTNGTYSLTAVCADTSGNTTTSSARSVTVNNPVVDTTPPTVTITAPASGAQVSGTIACSGTATDAGSSVVSWNCQVDGADAINSTADTTSPYSVNVNTLSYTNGSHTFRGTALDGSGNQGFSSAVTVTIANKPNSVFTCAPLRIQAPNTFTCTDASSLTPTSWVWSTTSCGSSTQQNPVFSCALGGRQQVCLTASNVYGAGTQSCIPNYIDVGVLPASRLHQGP